MSQYNYDINMINQENANESDAANDKDYEPPEEFLDEELPLSQQPQETPMIERRELSQEELDLMDILEHKNSPTLLMDFKKSKPLEAKRTFEKEKGPQPVTYFRVTLPDDPEYDRWYRVTSKKLRRAILMRYLPKDKTRLEITRSGSMKSTVHRIRAAQEDKVLVITNDKDYFEQAPLQQQRI